MHLFQGKKKKLTLKYKGNSYNLEVEPYEEISCIKKLMNKNYPNINLNEYNLIYDNKEFPKDDEIRFDELTKEKNIIIDLIKKENEKNEKTKNENLKIKCDCNNGIITTYCRICLKFICENCKNLLHSEHKILSFDTENLSENIKYYSIKLQAEISDNLNQYTEIENMFKKNLLIDYFSWKEIIIRKLESMEEIFKKFEQFDSLFKQKYENIEKLALDISKKIDKYINEISWNLLNNKKSKIIENNFEEIKKYFNNLSEYESKILIMKKKVDSRKEEFETNKKINKIFNNLDLMFDSLEKLTNKSYEIIKEKTIELNKLDMIKQNENKKKLLIYYNPREEHKSSVKFLTNLKAVKLKVNKNLMKSEGNIDVNKDISKNIKYLSDNQNVEKKSFRENYRTIVSPFPKSKNSKIKINLNSSSVDKNIKLPSINLLQKNI